MQTLEMRVQALSLLVARMAILPACCTALLVGFAHSELPDVDDEGQTVLMGFAPAQVGVIHGAANGRFVDQPTMEPAVTKSDASIAALCVTRDADRVGWIDGGEAFHVWSFARHSELVTIRASVLYRSVALSPDDRQVAVGQVNGTVQVYDTSTGKRTMSLAAQSEQAVYFLAFSSNSRMLAAASTGGTKCWLVAQKGRPVFSNEWALGWPVTSNGELIANWSFSRASIEFQRIADGATPIPAHSFDSATISCLGLSCDSNMLLVAHNNTVGTIQRYRLPEFHESFHVRAGPGEEHFDKNELSRRHGGTGILCLALSADCKWFATGRADKTVRIWDTQNGREVSCFRGHMGKVTCIVFSGDGQYLISGDSNGVIRIWDPSLHVRRGSLAENVLAKDDLTKNWQALTQGNNGLAVLRAAWRLVAGRNSTSSFLADKLQPLAADDPNRLKTLVGELDAPTSDRRDAAVRELSKTGNLAEADLRGSLNSQIGRDARQRAQLLLAQISILPEQHQLQWGLRVLAAIPTPEARSILSNIPHRYPGTWLAREAAAVLPCKIVEPR